MEHKNQDIDTQKIQNGELETAKQEKEAPESQTASHAWDILFLIALIVVVIVCCCALLF